MGVTFWVSIIFIGMLTFVVGEIANSFVALGTSLPDTFASMTAAEEGTYADAAIGNVTGSNSVNVMLGLGLPWVMASLFFMAKGEKFLVFVGDVGYSVTVYSIMACVCVMIIYMRRFCLGGELGGDFTTRTGTSILLIGMWVSYIVLSALESQRT